MSDARTEDAALARSRAALPPWGRAMLERIGAARDLEQQGNREQLAATLERNGYPVLEAVLRFEEQFGGLLIRRPGSDEGWRGEGRWSLAGAYGCLELGGDRAQREPDRGERGMVPVYYGWNDEIGFLDARGGTHLCYTIDEPAPRPFAMDGASMLSALMALDLLWSEGPWRRGLVERPGNLGAGPAGALGAALVVDNERNRLWVTSDVVVHESAGETLMGAFTDEAWARLRRL